jgi:selenocysteine-specific elongation factor
MDTQSQRAKHVILGTAGHIDHGKTELVKALTGVDTDRLQEEKERGITIELGFARFDLPSGNSLGVVDVPGHEKFVKTTVAGIGGMDIILLVIAADEGVMPQTREHLDIIDLLGVRSGIIALTKADLVSPDEIELAHDEAQELIEGTSLEGAAIIPVSSVTRDGLDELTAELDRLVTHVTERSSAGVARLPIDRAFTLAGHGTVVTGTLWSGRIKQGDKLAIYPQDRQTRVRSVQVHDHAVDEAVAGQRTALGIHGVSKDELSRGDTLGTPGALHVTHMIDARLRMVTDIKPIKNRTRVHLHLGTAEVLARVVLLESDWLRAGDESLVQLHLESPVVAEKDDLFVIRSYSPVTTIGGGRVLDPAPRRHKRMKDDVLESLTVLEEGEVGDIVLHKLGEAGIEGLADADVAGLAGASATELLDGLLSEGRLERLGGRTLTSSRYDELKSRTEELLLEFASASPLEWGMSAEELRTRLSKRLERGVLDAVLAALADDGKISRRSDLVRLGSGDVDLTDEQSRLEAEIETMLRTAGATPPTLDELKQELGGKDFDPIIKLLAETGRVIKVTSTLLFHPDVITDMRKALADYFDGGETQLGVPQFKDMVGVTRKYAIPLLEYFDREGTTMRSGNVRLRGHRR